MGYITESRLILLLVADNGPDNPLMKLLADAQNLRPDVLLKLLRLRD